MPLVGEIFRNRPKMAPASEFCEICHWRNIVLPALQDEDACEECHIPLGRMSTIMSPDCLRIQAAMHKQPPPLWMKIIKTQKLYGTSLVQSPDGVEWLRFPCRNMRPISSIWWTKCNLELNPDTFAI